jgi:hypothetical protein
MSSNQDQDDTGKAKDSGKATAEKVTIERRREPRVIFERHVEKDGSVMGKINDE